MSVPCTVVNVSFPVVQFYSVSISMCHVVIRRTFDMYNYIEVVFLDSMTRYIPNVSRHNSYVLCAIVVSLSYADFCSICYLYPYCP